MDSLTGVRQRFAALEPVLDEKSRRLLAAAESKAWGRGGISAVSKTTGVSRQAIRQGLRELEQAPTHPAGRIRRPGGGRKSAREKDPTLVADLERLVEPATRGDPESCLRWTSKSVRQLAAELERMGHAVSYPVVAELLHQMGYSLQANRKTKEGDSHPDRNAQFEHIHARVQQSMGLRQPVISVDTKKKELAGDLKNGGQDWRPRGKPEKVRVHDFLVPELGRASPYGIYDLAQNTGWVSVGIDHSPRRGIVCGCNHTTMVARHGSGEIPTSQTPDDYGRWWRQQRVPSASLETGTTEAGRRDRARHRRESLSSGNQQMEQD